jgi:hypothetical protein
LPASGYQRAVAGPGHVLDKRYLSGDCASAAALRAADEPDWLQSSFINGI